MKAELLRCEYNSCLFVLPFSLFFYLSFCFETSKRLQINEFIEAKH